MGCLNALPYEVILSKTSFKECKKYIESNYTEFYIIPPGYRIFDVHVIGVPPIYAAVDGEGVVFPYTKPCHGTFLVRVASAPEEVKRLRKQKPVRP
jgi:hypothetical protein